MKFEVPQFIDVEDKIFGPLSFKQFVYMGGGIGAVVFCYFFIGSVVLAIFLGGPLLLLGTLLAFYQVNNRPFAALLQAFFEYTINKKLYLWMHRDRKPKATDLLPQVERPQAPRMSQNKLKDLAWELDLKHSMYDNTSQVQ